jgi:anti-sigma B factor antagonist
MPDGMGEPASELRAAELRVVREGGVTILSISGEADLHSAPELRDTLAATIEDDGAEVVLDLTQTTFVDSMTLGILLGALKRVRSGGGHLRVADPGADVRRIFEMTQLDRVFPMHATREEAVDAARASGNA